MTSTPEQVIAKIREALEAVEPIEWFEYSEPEVGYFQSVHCKTGDKYGTHLPIWDDPAKIRYVAACNPQNIAVLMGEITDLQSVVQCMNEDFAAVKAERDALRHDIERYVAIAAELANSPAALQSAADTPAPQPNSAGITLSAEKVIAIRDALVGDSVEEAYHLLYSAIDPDFVKLEPWAEIEAAALSPFKAKEE